MQRFSLLDEHEFEYDHIIAETLISIHEEFLDRFGVDLDDKKYLEVEASGATLEEVWGHITEDCFNDNDVQDDTAIIGLAKRTGNSIETAWKFLTCYLFNDKDFVKEYTEALWSVLESNGIDGKEAARSIINAYKGSDYSTRAEITAERFAEIIDSVALSLGKTFEEIWGLIFNEEKNSFHKNFWYAIYTALELINDVINTSGVNTILEDPLPNNIDHFSIDINPQLDEIANFYNSLKSQYYMYDIDVWLDAVYTLDYVDLDHCQSSEIDFLTLENIKDNIDNSYDIIFTEDEILSEFCQKLKKTLLDHYNLKIFDVDYYFDAYGISSTEVSYKYNGISYPSIDTKFLADCDFTRWSYPNIKLLENTEGFSLDDDILFQKITNAVIVRNAVYDFSYNDISIADGRGLLYMFDDVNSFSWKMFLVFFFSSIINMTDNSCTDEERLKCMNKVFSLWKEEDAAFINETERTLARGLIYVYTNHKFEGKSTDNLYSVATERMETLKGLDKDIHALMLEDIENIKGPLSLTEEDKDPDNINGLKKIKIKLRTNGKKKMSSSSWAYAIYQRDQMAFLLHKNAQES